MEDAATAEISRSSLWQGKARCHHGFRLGLHTSFEKMLDEEYNVVQEEVGRALWHQVSSLRLKNY